MPSRLSDVEKQLTDRVYSRLEASVPRLLADQDISAKISKEILRDVAKHCSVRLIADQKHQDNGIKFTKYVGYIVYWFRKLKPISAASQKNNPTCLIVDINERLALRLGFILLGELDLRHWSSKLAKHAAECSDIDNQQVVNDRIVLFANFFFSNPEFYDYLVQTLRYRISSPDFIVLFLDTIIAGSFYNIEYWKNFNWEASQNS